jgi:IclR family mhp operon transcriptional activator
MLSVMTEEEIDTASVVAQIEATNSQYIWDRKAIRKLIGDVRKAGYASSVGESEANISAIALPLRVRRIVGAVNIVFFRSAMTPQTAAERYLEPLKESVRKGKKALST